MTHASSTYISNTDKFRPHITPVPDRLRYKVALVTGAARGIGKAIAIRFAQEGARVVVTDKDMEPAQQTAAELGAHGEAGIALHLDVTDRGEVERAVESTIGSLGSIDILVNNAGMIVFDSLMECRIEDWNRMLAVDLTGALHCTQAAGRLMVQQGRGGRLIHIGSTASLLPTPQQAAYSVAKAGLRMMSRMAAMELVQHGITSNLICPEGAITDINRELLSDSAIMEQLEEKIPSGRFAHVEEIAAVAAFLAADESAYITGTELVHDGGAVISGLWWR